ncbi:alpha/beta hydrolase [Limosilactobacillus sp.]|jgi:fermentation-respiration switch protein FrsA (DUF1100 family)|uniref:alpha/beta hydrolase n=1 Tax=Limosilactobacillus sp. TaxID=2773925 RepID=UPI0025B889A8|nr:alpha/beta hydrolase [Limosilactobacillus sp.]MCH3921875.1 alpha/beta hydrolase [Limosilactobacillus sp.]MCH3928646.1 alpha/beta hydrolase [Limosilactobacillus sp.]
MKKVSFYNYNGQGITMVANVFFPPEFDEKKQYPAIIFTHPAGGVKEQTSGLYARQIAQAGFVTIAFDASYQGESSGLPRHLENPYIRVEDISAVVDYLTTLEYVDAARIGAAGICAGGGYTVNAAINDKRIKALATVSAANFGAMMRNGWTNNQDDAAALPMLKQAAEARTKDRLNNTYQTVPLVPLKEEDAPTEEMRQAWEYYKTPRGAHPNSVGYATFRNFTQVLTYDAFFKANVFLTQPLLVIYGTQADSKWVSERLMAEAATKDKQAVEIAGANHMELYDKPEYVSQAVAAMDKFFAAKL